MDIFEKLTCEQRYRASGRFSREREESQEGSVFRQGKSRFALTITCPRDTFSVLKLTD